MDDVKELMRRLKLSDIAGNETGQPGISGRASYMQPIDDSSSIEFGARGHSFKNNDNAVDRIDAKYSKRFDNKSKLRAGVGANVNKMRGKQGIDEARIEYEIPFKKGGKVKAKAKPTVSSRADGIAQRGKTRGRYL